MSDIRLNKIAKITAAMVREFFETSDEKLSHLELPGFIAKLRGMFDNDKPEIAQSTADMVRETLQVSGDRLSRSDYLAFVAQVRASLLGEEPAPIEAEPATSSVHTHSQEPETDSAGGRERPIRPKASLANVPTPEEDPSLDVVHKELLHCKPKRAYAETSLKKPGRRYEKQRNAFEEGPAVQPARSYNNAYIVCLEDGHKVKYLKRHLKTYYGMTVEAYKEKWGLPADYPAIPPYVHETRSRLSKKFSEQTWGNKSGTTH